jgi:hypothetical protein
MKNNKHDKETIVIIEDNPTNVYTVLMQLGDEYNLKVLCTIKDVFLYLFEVRSGNLPSPKIILTDCHLPMGPVKNHVECILAMLKAETKEDIVQQYQDYLDRSKTIGQELLEIHKKIQENEELLARRDKLLEESYFTIPESGFERGKFEDLKRNADSLDGARYDLLKDLYKEMPIGIMFVMEFILMQVPYIGLLKSSGHGMPQMTWYAELLLNRNSNKENNIHVSSDGDLLKLESGPFVRTVKVGKSKVVLAFNEYDIINGESGSGKQWNLLLGKLLS